MGYTCQMILKHTNSFQMAENAMTHSCAHIQYARKRKAGSFYFYTFHSAEGHRRYNEPQRSPNFMITKCLLYICALPS